MPYLRKEHRCNVPRMNRTPGDVFMCDECKVVYVYSRYWGAWRPVFFQKYWRKIYEATQE